MPHSPEILADKEKIELESLQHNFCEMFDVEKREAALELFKKIVKKYQSEDRAYHNLEHVGNFLSFLEKFKEKIQDEGGVRLAVWFHDIVYDTRANDNEEQSAEYAQTTLRSMNIPEKTIAHAVALIRATAKHESIDGDSDSEIFLDGDLAVLGSDEGEYDDYAKKIRKEYAWVSDNQYRIGRRKILENFLNRSKIYFTDEVGKDLEQRAKRNIEREIKTLS